MDHDDSREKKKRFTYFMGVAYGQTPHLQDLTQTTPYKVFHCRHKCIRSVVCSSVYVHIDFFGKRNTCLNAALNFGMDTMYHVRHTSRCRRTRNIQLGPFIVVKYAAHDIVVELLTHLCCVSQDR